MNKYQALRREYLTICAGNFNCDGDSIPDCPYYKTPYIDGSGQELQGACLLKIESAGELLNGATIPGFNELAEDVHKNAVNHGWYEKTPSFPEVVALFHSELSEALEEYRNGKDIAEIRFDCKGAEDGGYCSNDSKCSDCINSKPAGVGIELADCIIRILDTCHAEGIDIEKAIAIKHEYNKSRPYKHGGKKL